MHGRWLSEEVLEIEADSTNTHSILIFKQQTDSPSLGDQACTQPEGTSRGSPRASTLLPLFWENSQLWPFLAVLGAAPLPWVSGQSSSPPTPPQGSWVVANHGPSQTDTCAHWLGQRTGAWKEEGVCGPGTQNGNRKGDRGGSSSTHYNIHEVNAN